MYALIVIDAQNEFSKEGKRPVPNFSSAVKSISQRAEQARKENFPIAWIRHFNKPNETKAFVPNTWGAEFHSGFGLKPGSDLEVEFSQKCLRSFCWYRCRDLAKISTDKCYCNRRILYTCLRFYYCKGSSYDGL